MSSNQDPDVSTAENHQPDQPKMNSTEERPREKRSTRENNKTYQQKRQEDYITEGVKAKTFR